MAEGSAPGSSANLGPGFDCLAVAWELRCRVEAEPAAEWSVTHLNECAPTTGENDAVLAAAQELVGIDNPLSLTVDNLIPLGKGLGSSAAARTAATVAVWRCQQQEVNPAEVFTQVARWEGHPDNVAAAVYGGLVLVTADGGVRSLEWDPQLKAIVIEPTRTLSTTTARLQVSPQLSLEVVTRSLARMAALVQGLGTGDCELLEQAGGDEVHEQPRSGHHPDVSRVVVLAREAGAAHAAWSGAGPSVLAIVSASEREQVAARLEQRLGADFAVRRPEISSAGFL